MKEEAYKYVPSVYASHRTFNGYVKRVRHFSKVNDCVMSFSIFIPDFKKRID